MRLLKLLSLVLAASILTFGTAQLLYEADVDPFKALLFQGVFGVVAGGFAILILCEDYDKQFFGHVYRRFWRMPKWLKS